MRPHLAASGPDGLFTPFVSASLASVELVDALAWLSIAGFVVAIVFEWRDRVDVARYVAAVSAALFGAFWLLMVPYYWGEVNSPLQSMLALAALPLCLYVGYLLVQGRDSLLVLVRAVAVMGIIYLPAETIPFFRQWLIETTAYQTHLAMDLVATSPGLNEGANGYESRFNFDSDETATGRTTYIILACTGLGSMAIFAGLIAAVRAPWKRKALGIGVAVGIIWFLNLVRNVFIGLATPHGWFQQGPFVYMATEWMGSVPERTSFLMSHNVIAQPLSVVALVFIAYVTIKLVPEVLAPLEEVLFVLTGTEYDLAETIGAEVPESETGKVTAD
nr:archaeosortase A [Halovivax gelatinilyticus]